MRIVPLTLGILTLGIAWLSLFLGVAERAFYAHMIVHMGVVAVAAPLLAFAIAQGPWDPVRRTPALFSPLPASFLELVVVWVWHTPTLHMAARSSAPALIAEQGSFLVSGLFLWISVLGGSSDARPGRSAAGIVALLLTAMHMTLLGALLALAPRPLYAHMHGASGLWPLEDQHLGGAIMLIIGGVCYLFGGLWLALALLRQPEAT